MKNLGLDFETIPSSFDERAVKEADPLRLVKTLALEKARVVTQENPGSVVIGADTMVQIADEFVGKPKDLEEARRMLRKASGQEVKDFVGLAVIFNNQEKAMSSIGRAKMKSFGDKEIDSYLSRVNPLDKAGGFAGAAAEGGEFYASYSGEPGQEFGLPLTSLEKFLTEFGVAVPKQD